MIVNFSLPYQSTSLRSGARRPVSASRDRFRSSDILASNTKKSSLHLSYEIPEIHQRARRENLSQALSGEVSTVKLSDPRQLTDIFELRQRSVNRGFTCSVDLFSRTTSSHARDSARAVMGHPVGANTLPLVVLEKAKILLGECNVREAVCLLQAGVEQFPSDSRIASLLKVILPQGRARKVNSFTKNRQKETSWIKTHGREYKGKWIALDGDELVAFSDTLRQLLENMNLMRQERMPLIQYIGSGTD